MTLNGIISGSGITTKRRDISRSVGLETSVHVPDNRIHSMAGRKLIIFYYLSLHPPETTPIQPPPGAE